MSETELTKKIKSAIYKRLHSKTRYRFAFEVPIKSGYADCVAYELDYRNNCKPYVICYEIKISFTDFKSNNGHNLYGDENYYIITKELFEEIKRKGLLEKLTSENIGVFVYYVESDVLKKKIQSKSNTSLDKKLSNMEYFKLVDNICRLWQNGKMQYYSKGYNVQTNLKRYDGANSTFMCVDELVNEN